MTKNYPYPSVIRVMTHDLFGETVYSLSQWRLMLVIRYSLSSNRYKEEARTDLEDLMLSDVSDPDVIMVVNGEAVGHVEGMRAPTVKH